MNKDQKMIACWFLVTWHDNRVQFLSMRDIAISSKTTQTQGLLLIASYIVDAKWLLNSDRE